MAILGADREQLNFKKEEGTLYLRSFVESTIVSETPDIDRITRYTLYWHFYKGKHWRQYNETFLSFNYCRAFVDKVINFLVGRQGFSFKITPYSSMQVDEETEQLIEGFFDYHWRKNKKISTVHDILQMGSVVGDVWPHLQWDDKRKCVSISVPDSRHCFPEFDDGDTTRMTKFILRQPLIKNKEDYKVLVIEYTDTTIIQWQQKDTSVNGKRFNEKQIANPFGFIPVVHIKNKPTSDGYYSTSDLADILKINKTYNEMVNQLKAIIDYYGTPTTVITGATAKTLRKGLGNIWSGLPPEANVFNLGLGEDLNSSIQFVKELLKAPMHELADVPENALGKIQAISNTSAAALQITYQPLIQQADQKWLMYGDGIVELNIMIAKIHRIIYPDAPIIQQLDAMFNEPFEDLFMAEPVFVYGLPQDRNVELNQCNLELTMKIASRREIMNRLGKKNVPMLIQEIDRDSLNLQLIQNSGFGDEGTDAKAQEAIAGEGDGGKSGGGTPSNKPAKKKLE